MTKILKINYQNVKRRKTQKRPKSYKLFIHHQKKRIIARNNCIKECNSTKNSKWPEWKKSKSDTLNDSPSNINSLKDRMQRSMTVTFNKESEIVEKNLTFLATAGSTAPFVGLFGTVWGIMNSFKSIAVAQNTNLSVVAPGIAEALFATALGLFVAIPAVVAYNKISSDLSKYFISLETFMDEFSTIFFRQLEKK